ncbi:CASP7 protein, partial [Centropus bengalensis]|nr:CASP7 protein [Centropus bengalensis]
MAQVRRSRALVVVNTHFQSNHGDEVPGIRSGAKPEAKKLFKVLSRLNYAVELVHNKTAKEIEDLYRQERCHQHGEFFVSIISSHGEDGVIFGCDWEPVKLSRLFRILSSEKCPALRKIPKIFFIQACRGKALDQGVFVEADSGDPKPERDPEYLLDFSIPPQTVVTFACSPGYAAFLNPSGSMFLQALLKVLEGEERHLDLIRLLTRVNGKVAFHCQARGIFQGCKQMPCFITNLQEEVFPFSA